MTSAIGSISGVYATQAFSHAARADVVTGNIDIPESNLRTNQIQATVPAERDYLADSVELTRVHPQLLAQSYAPTPAQQTQIIAALADEAAERGFMDTRNDDATGAQMELAVEESHAAPGEDDETESPDNADSARENPADNPTLSEEEQQQVKELADRDREVRAHEQAHKSVGGQYAGAMSFEYQQGPDGQRYAVGGEVSIDTSTERDPEATIQKMRQVRAAALAPADPSGQDRSVAAAASAKEADASQQLAQLRREQAMSDGSANTETDTSTEAAGATTRTTNTDQAPQLGNTADAPSTFSAVSSPYAQSGFGNTYHSIDVVA